MLYLKKYYRKIIIILIPFLILMVFIQMYKKENNIVINENYTSDNETELIDNVDNHEKKLNIKGAVVNPGVYSFNEGERVFAI